MHEQNPYQLYILCTKEPFNQSISFCLVFLSGQAAVPVASPQHCVLQGVLPGWSGFPVHLHGLLWGWRPAQAAQGPEGAVPGGDPGCRVVCADCHGSPGNLTSGEVGRREGGGGGMGEEGGRRGEGGGPMGSVLADPGGDPGGQVVCVDCHDSPGKSDL